MNGQQREGRRLQSDRACSEVPIQGLWRQDEMWARKWPRINQRRQRMLDQWNNAPPILRITGTRLG